MAFRGIYILGDSLVGANFRIQFGMVSIPQQKRLIQRLFGHSVITCSQWLPSAAVLMYWTLYLSSSCNGFIGHRLA
jgi:hypothetical protein